ncbi:MAG: leucyl aminopeptidase family protein, partial [Planctomycetota bacterium]
RLEENALETLVAGFLCGCEGQDLYRDETARHSIDRLVILDADTAAIQHGVILGDAINHTRRLVNEPANVMTPAAMADVALEMAKSSALEVEVWDEQQLKDQRCNAILAVGGGSVNAPRLVQLRLAGGAPDQAPVVLVGKGVTFDSGGYSLKPGPSMLDMKCDMAGAATVYGVMHAIAAMGLPINVVGICGLAENMVDGAAYRLGDVITTRSGKTVEIHNTDAEGRVVLSDCLNVASEMSPDAIVDLATLTGACVVALGTEIVGLMENDEELLDDIMLAATVEHERVWPLPMDKMFDEQVKSKVADLRNVGEGRWGGAITAAKFLEAFVGDGIPWVHMDIAGPAYADKPQSHLDAGGTGVMVRTLVRWLQHRVNEVRSTGTDAIED